MVPKFRAWDKNTNDMVDVKTIDLEKDGSIGCIVDYNGINLDVSECVLMQSTGLKDKNGVEIFEGDVVRYTWDMLSDVNATEKGKKVRKSKVFWSDWRASWAVGKKSCNNDLFRYARNGNTVEVIGNIYENPELLEQADES
ncbi:hypothetical protein IV471_01035 [Enterococcus gallinarum]|uniref:YopX family protein n=1 Tax=Enterococcus gallinarum TaxID=1353 RepID=UPI001E52CB80|nr:YopX family protein [Enterococcus gallinarum]MCD5183879.1 hypothetical protein [Enterococcus gallinarum]